MCKIVKYRFTCQHGFRLRTSQCGGTKHKKVRDGWTVACKSDPYLTVTYSIDCGPCQHQAFEEGWRRKLELAKTFRDRLKDKCLPGVEEAVALVEQLDDEFDTASWETQIRFPHCHKDRAVRVNLGHFEERPSPLRQELLPEDVREPSDVIGPNHPEYEYDWDYVASTDPLHPVDVNYAHPLDENASWILNHLSPAELEQASDGVGFDANEADTMWAASSKNSKDRMGAPYRIRRHRTMVRRKTGGENE